MSKSIWALRLWKIEKKIKILILNQFRFLYPIDQEVNWLKILILIAEPKLATISISKVIVEIQKKIHNLKLSYHYEIFLGFS